ncbi:phenylacetate--CoA ligase [Bacillus sp. M6-12]|uniref:phenylacetate--CoA ligase family protein n=1 Tax=Bacillus sp. M6-12 TaxID=2054166 RepID=UPI000C761F09|nr:phenylacetate--CoA ligase family protein [Bacillus sp. M6-12]PLS15276.1 phenylacetate--CoA ligase [Bacillus sp. M6-12]
MLLTKECWNPEIETLNYDQIRELQFKNLKKQLYYCFATSPFYKDKFKMAGAEPGDIKTMDDFRNLPIFYGKEDDRKSQEKSRELFGHPFGLQLCADPQKVVAANATSGTTGNPTFYAFTENDIKVQNEAFARGYWRAGIRPGDRVLMASGLSMWLGGTSVMRGLQGMGACPIPVGAEAGAERLLTFASLSYPSAMVATPSIATYLIDKAPSIIGKEVGELGIKRIVVLGEPGASIPEVRQRIESAWRAKLYDGASGIWGLHSVSCSSPAYEGLHAYCEDKILLWDIVDPVSKKPLKIENGAIGEQIITALDWQASPALRYAFGDIIQIFTEPCPHCGFSWIRWRIIGRTDDVLNVKGVKLYPVALKEVLETFIPRISGEFRIVLNEKPPRVTPPLNVKMEYGHHVDKNQLSALKNEIEDACARKLSVRPDISLVPPGSLPKDPSKKTKYIEKNY